MKIKFGYEKTEKFQFMQAKLFQMNLLIFYFQKYFKRPKIHLADRLLLHFVNLYAVN